MQPHVVPKTRYQMREKLAAIGDDWWIEDDHGNKMFKVNEKAMHMRDTFVLEDANGNELATIQERKLHIRDTMAIERDGKKIATVQRRLVGSRHHLHVEIEGGHDMKVHGKLAEHKYEIKGEHGKVAEVSKEWFKLRDTYGVDIEAGQDHALILAITVAVEDLTVGEDG